MASLTSTRTITNGGTSYQQAPLVVTGTNLGTVGPVTPLAVAKTGTLSTRASATAGTLTMAGGHGITTAARLDIYWSGGARRGVTVGTVSGNSVPFTLGAGDDLPAQDAAVTAMVPESYSLVVTGDDVTLANVFNAGACPCSFVFAEADDSTVFGVTVNNRETPNGTGDGWSWTDADDTTNPFDGGAITQIFMSHGSSTATQTPVANVLYNS